MRHHRRNHHRFVSKPDGLTAHKDLYASGHQAKRKALRSKPEWDENHHDRYTPSSCGRKGQRKALCTITKGQHKRKALCTIFKWAQGQAKSVTHHPQVGARASEKRYAPSPRGNASEKRHAPSQRRSPQNSTLMSPSQVPRGFENPPAHVKHH